MSENHQSTICEPRVCRATFVSLLTTSALLLAESMWYYPLIEGWKVIVFALFPSIMITYGIGLAHFALSKTGTVPSLYHNNINGYNLLFWITLFGKSTFIVCVILGERYNPWKDNIFGALATYGILMIIIYIQCCELFIDIMNKTLTEKKKKHFILMYSSNIILYCTYVFINSSYVTRDINNSSIFVSVYWSFLIVVALCISIIMVVYNLILCMFCCCIKRQAIYPPNVAPNIAPNIVPNNNGIDFDDIESVDIA